jgi:hypothetical protein
MARYLFVGPTLPDVDDQTSATAVEVLPPIAAGDLLRLPLTTGDVVGIVDGYFHQVRPLRHKEVLATLAKGVRVMGAASLGALRAAELAPFGMEGVGEIYRSYRTGVLDADDEVTLLHGPSENHYPAFSEPLVNIRATLRQACERGLIDEATGQLLIAGLAALPYPARSYSRLLEIALDNGMSAAQRATLERFCRDFSVDQKRADAVELLDVLRVAEGPTKPPSVQPSMTIFLHAWELAAKRVGGTDGTERVSEMALLRVCQLFARDYPVFHRRQVLDFIATECRRECGPNGMDTDTVAIVHGVHRGLYGDPDGGGADWGFLRGWLTPEERRVRSLRDQLLLLLVRSFRISPGIPADEVAMTGLRNFPVMVDAHRLVRACMAVNEDARRQDQRFTTDSLPAQRVVEFMARHWDTTASEVDLAALDRGIESHAALVALAREHYLAAKYNPALADLWIAPREPRRTCHGNPTGCREDNECRKEVN